MFTALYYPHVRIGTDLFKNALFLWDRIEYIAPYPDFRPRYDDKELGEAVRAFAEPHAPTHQEKQQAEDAILDLLNHSLPDWFYIKEEQLPPSLLYSMFAEKLFPETWEKLNARGLAQPIHTRFRFRTTAPLGLTIMSLLADCCAGAQKRLVTDETASYSALDRYLATIGGAELGKFDAESERLVTITLKIMDFKRVSLSRLIALREKEKSASGAHLTALRHGYLMKI